MIPVRLRESDVKIVIEAFKKYFDAEDHLWLFGSRADLSKRGGDIDLYIETLESDLDVLLRKKSRFLNELWDRLGEQKIDIVLHRLTEENKLPIYSVAREQGVLLV